MVFILSGVSATRRRVSYKLARAIRVRMGWRKGMVTDAVGSARDHMSVES
jgi:hypothetical protein